MSHSLAVKDKEGKYKRFTVPFEVSQYVKQLETYIMHPGASRLKEAYPERFSEAPNLLDACEWNCRMCLLGDTKGGSGQIPCEICATKTAITKAKRI